MSDAGRPLTRAELSAEIARLRTELDEMVAEAHLLRGKTSQNDKQRAQTEKEIRRLEALLGAVNDRIAVSDHAVIRYLERRYGFDFETVRDEILTPVTRSAVKAGATSVKVDGGTFKISGRTIVTYVRGT